MSSEEEVWKPVPVGPDHVRRLYQVSNRGRVRSVKTKGDRRGWYVLAGRRQSANDHVPYRNVVLAGKKHYIHRLVCQAFHGPAPEGKPIVLHRDGNPVNCDAANLRWGSRADNGVDDLRHRRRHLTRLLSEQEVLQIRSLYRGGMSLKALADTYKVSAKAIRQVISYQTWKHLP